MPERTLQTASHPARQRRTASSGHVKAQSPEETTSTAPVATTTATTAGAVSATTAVTTPATTVPATTVPATTFPAATAAGSDALLPPSSVLVEVLNGSGVPHVAASTAHALRDAGFLVNGTANASSFEHVENVVEYSPGSEQAAATVAADVTGASELVEVAGLAPDEVNLVVGEDFGGLRT